MKNSNGMKEEIKLYCYETIDNQWQPRRQTEFYFIKKKIRKRDSKKSIAFISDMIDIIASQL